MQGRLVVETESAGALSYIFFVVDSESETINGDSPSRRASFSEDTNQSESKEDGAAIEKDLLDDFGEDTDIGEGDEDLLNSPKAPAKVKVWRPSPPLELLQQSQLLQRNSSPKGEESRSRSVLGLVNRD